MSFFSLDNDTEAILGDRFQKVIAKLDHRATSERGEDVLFFDCLAAWWLDEHQVSVGGLLAPDSAGEAAVSLLEIKASDAPPLSNYLEIEFEVLDQLAGVNPDRLSASQFDPMAALHFPRLLGPPSIVRITKIAKASRSDAIRVGLLGSMSGLPDASVRALRAIVDVPGKVTSAAVFDVGQGNWNALVSDGRTVLSFDVGGGIGAHESTFPPSFKSFCFGGHRGVVLSHWDWDHWSSAIRFPDSQLLTWIVPRQGPLGASHAVFLALLRRRGHVLVVGDSFTHRFGQVELQRAKGPKKSKNASGIGLILWDSQNSKKRCMVFPGDAGFGRFAINAPAVSVVVPHHGGIVPKIAPVPRRTSDSVGISALSYGAPNQYGHPRTRTLDHFRSWSHTGRLLKTTSRSNVPGHIEMRWSSKDAATGKCCRQSQFPLAQN